MAVRIQYRIAGLLGAAALWCSPAAAAEDGGPGAAARQDREARMTRLALEIHRYRLESGLRVVLNPVQAASTVAVCMSFPNQIEKLAPDDSWSAYLLQIGRHHDLDLAPAAARQLAWRGLFRDFDPSPDFVSFARVIPAHDLHLGVWTMARQSQGSAPRDLAELRRSVYLEARYGGTLDRSRALGWLRRAVRSEGDDAAFSLEALAKLPLDRVRALAHGFWHSGQAVLTVTGAFETEQARAFIEQHFASDPSTHATPVRREARPAPPTPSKHRTMGSSRLSSVFVGFAIPAVDHPDHPALKLLTHLLSDTTLKGHWDRSVSTPRISASTSDTTSLDLLWVEVRISSAEQAASVERRIRAVVGGIAKRPPSPRRLSAALERERTVFWARFESPASRALMLGQAEARRGDARLVLRDLDNAERVTPADVARVAKQYLASSEPAVLVATPGGFR